MNIEEDFIRWERKVRIDIEFVADFLKHKLSDEPENLITDLQNAEAWIARVGFILAEADSWLDKCKFIEKAKIAPGTAFDREIELDSLISPYRLTRDKLRALSEALKSRCITGMSLLAYHRPFQEHKTKNLEKLY